MQPMPSKFGTSPLHWFGRGLASGVILVAAANALSYFVRSQSIADLIGSKQDVQEAMGFPFKIWDEGTVFRNAIYVDYAMVGLNLLVGLVLGTVLGIAAVCLRHRFNGWVAEFERKNPNVGRLKVQFSVKSMLLITTIAAVLIATLTRWNGTPEVLIAIYFLGPIALLSIAMLPSKIHWQHRAAIVSLMAVGMIGIAISSGMLLKVPIDRVLLGIFVSWTPQSAFGAFLLTVGLTIQLLWFNNPTAQHGEDSVHNKQH